MLTFNKGKGMMMALASTRDTDADAGEEAFYVGVDFGTSGVRATATDASGAKVAETRVGYGEEEARLVMQSEDVHGVQQTKWHAHETNDIVRGWRWALHAAIVQLPLTVRKATRAICVDGTSATALLVDAETGVSRSKVAWYCDAQPDVAVAKAREWAPEGHTSTSSTSTLAKLACFVDDGGGMSALDGTVLAHQADVVASWLHGRHGVTDWNNALKLGFDAKALSWPDWLASAPVAPLLPRAVHAPGELVAPVTEEAASLLSLPGDGRCQVCAGTTDSIAAFLALAPASGAFSVGDAVTSLGSTIAIKLVSDVAVEDAACGVYSHRLRLPSLDESSGTHRLSESAAWLASGASNAGAACLRAEVGDDAILARLTDELMARPSPLPRTGLAYYPLPRGRPGERFPVSDASKPPVYEPRPDDDATFFLGLLESLSDIEADGYAALRRLGAPAPRRILTAGGGSINAVWRQLRADRGLPVTRGGEDAVSTEASYGAARLARAGVKGAL